MILKLKQPTKANTDLHHCLAAIAASHSTFFFLQFYFIMKVLYMYIVIIQEIPVK